MQKYNKSITDIKVYYYYYYHGQLWNYVWNFELWVNSLLQVKFWIPGELLNYEWTFEIQVNFELWVNFWITSELLNYRWGDRRTHRRTHSSPYGPGPGKATAKWFFKSWFLLMKRALLRGLKKCYICFTLRSWANAILSHFRVVSPGLGDNYVSKCSFDNVSHTKYITMCGKL